MCEVLNMWAEICAKFLVSHFFFSIFKSETFTVLILNLSTKKRFTFNEWLDYLQMCIAFDRRKPSKKQVHWMLKKFARFNLYFSQDIHICYSKIVQTIWHFEKKGFNSVVQGAFEHIFPMNFETCSRSTILNDRFK